MPKVVVVSGGTSGIGQKCAEQLTMRGHTVYATGRRVGTDELDHQVAYKLVRCDVTDQQSVDKLITQVMDEQGRIDVLINCAGFALGGGVEDTTVEEAQRQFEVNFFGTHRMIRAVLPVMRQQRNGSIITVSSVASEFAIPFQVFYSASKMALDGMMQAVRMEGRAFGIEATCVNPGDVKSGFTEARHQAEGCHPGSPYYDLSMRSIETMKKDEMAGLNPERVAGLVCDLMEKRKLKPKYFVEGKYKAVMILKRILPSQTVEKLLVQLYLS